MLKIEKSLQNKDIKNILLYNCTMGLCFKLSVITQVEQSEKHKRL